MRKKHQSIPVEDEGLVVALYLGGSSSVEIAKQYNVTPPTVSCLLKKSGVPTRTRSELNRMRAPLDDHKLLRLNEEAMLSQREIATKLGVSQATIERALRRLGVQSKKGRGAPLEKNYFWNGGRTKDVDGYILVKAPDHPFADCRGYVREHRLVMEAKLGRYLEKNEVVHHRDGVHDNNDQDNLEVYSTNAEHLQDELTGRTPNYSPDGLQRMRENALQLNRRKSSSSQKE